jgi:two-component system, cell cycle response regulator
VVGVFGCKKPYRQRRKFTILPTDLADNKVFVETGLGGSNMAEMTQERATALFRGQTCDVVAVGLPTADVNILQRMFALTGSRARAYRVLTHTEAVMLPHVVNRVYVADQDMPTSVDLWQSWQMRRASPTIFIGSGMSLLPALNSPAGITPSFIRRPLLLPRVLTALDETIQQEERRQANPLKGTTGPTAAPSAMRVMVVDANQATIAQLDQALRAHAIKALLVSTREEALLKAFEQPFDLVFLDAVMPGMDAYEVCKQLRQYKHGKAAARVVLLTSGERMFDKIRGALAGCESHLSKPVDSDTLDRVIKDAARARATA